MIGWSGWPGLTSTFTHLQRICLNQLPPAQFKRPAHSFIPLVTVWLLKMAFGFLSNFSQICLTNFHLFWDHLFLQPSVSRFCHIQPCMKLPALGSSSKSKIIKIFNLPVAFLNALWVQLFSFAYLNRLAKNGQTQLGIPQALWVPSSTKMTSWSLFQKNTVNLIQAVLARQPLVLSMRVILFSTVLFAQQSCQWRLGSWQAKTTNLDPSHNKNRWRVWSSLCLGVGVLSHRFRGWGSPLG